MNAFSSSLLDGLRVVLLRSPRGNAIGTGAGAFVALIGVYLLVAFAIAAFDIGAGASLDLSGVPTVLADCLLTLVAAWLLVRFAQRDVLWGAAAILLAATIACAVIVHWPLAHAARALFEHDHVLFGVLVRLVSRAWWFLVLIAFAHWLAPRHLGRVLLAAVAAYAISAAVWWWLPSNSLASVAIVASVENADSDDGDEVSTPPVDTGTTANDATDSDAAVPAEADFDAEKVMYAQQGLLDAALARLAPQTPGKADLYVVAFAGDASEDVFRNEAEYAERLFGQRFGATGRVLVLENNAATVATRPLATWTNLSHALDAIAKKMNPAEDILLLYVTTHGSKDHQLLVDLDPLPLNQIEPDDIADALKTEPQLRWKIVVVNACYSGGFIDALRDDSTMVIASAREDRTSFGCGVDSDITYFGKAFLAEALNRTNSLREAFDIAKTSVEKWETADKEEHSEPQIASTRSIEAKLDAWRRTLAPAEPVPFAPAAATAP